MKKRQFTFPLENLAIKMRGGFLFFCGGGGGNFIYTYERHVNGWENNQINVYEIESRAFYCLAILKIEFLDQHQFFIFRKLMLKKK